MTEKIKLLLELQELAITLNECEILHGEDAETKVLKDRHAKIRQNLDADTLAKYDRLARLGLAVVELNGSMCLGCHMSIPAGDLNRIHNANIDPVCPNCGHFLTWDAS
jgi:predicted  nucleic acid-binding Zn-ribbon protein